MREAVEVCGYLALDATIVFDKATWVRTILT